jgi:hypothetical protein
MHCGPVFSWSCLPYFNQSINLSIYLSIYIYIYISTQIKEKWWWVFIGIGISEAVDETRTTVGYQHPLVRDITISLTLVHPATLTMDLSMDISSSRNSNWLYFADAYNGVIYRTRTDTTEVDIVMQQVCIYRYIDMTLASRVCVCVCCSRLDVIYTWQWKHPGDTIDRGPLYLSI